MKKINVSIYGGKSIFGGREQPYNVDVAYCDKCDKCDFYKNGTCFNAGRWKGNCEIGKKENIQGWTSRAVKGREFFSKWKNDECYDKLREPKQKVGIVDGIVILNIEDMIIENGQPVEYVHFGSTPLSYLELEKFTPELIKKICDLRPKVMFGYEPIRAYYEEYVPRFFRRFEKILPKYI